MTHGRTVRGRSIAVPALTRVEGEGGLEVVIRDGQVTDARLDIYEPPRFFEALLRGRRYTEPPDITARICGICPIAYQMSSCQAIEDACGVQVPEPIALLRRLIYCGEWIESHTLHVYLLHAPDFLGYESGLHMARERPELLQRGLRLKKAGNRLIEVIGGRSVHPVNVRGHSVCLECNRAGITCVKVAHGTPCLGPVTHAGCGALCPSYARGCYGCFGPMEAPNTAALAAWWQALGVDHPDLARVFRTFNANAAPFRKEAEAHDPR